MTILGIESATEYLSAALIRDGLEPLVRSRQSLSSHCELLTGFFTELTEEAGISPNAIEGIAVSTGPGSFTGLRIGIASAMGLAYGLGIRTAPVGTLAALAFASAAPGSLVCPVIDAKRSEMYAGLFRLTDGIPDTVIEPSARSLDNLAGLLVKACEPVTITGPAAGLLHNHVSSHTLSSLSFITSPDAVPSAVSVSGLGLCIFEAGGAVEPAMIEPVYIRRSDAEILRDGGFSG